MESIPIIDIYGLLQYVLFYNPELCICETTTTVN